MNITAKILAHFLQSSGSFVSGEQLAGELSMSRVSIRNHLEKLRLEGFEFEAVRNRGYRLTRWPKAFHCDLLQACWSRHITDVSLYAMEEVDSTNSEASRLLTNGEATPLVVIAGKQTLGRGRRGRQWHSPAEGNLYASFGFRPKTPASRMQCITLFLGLRLSIWLKERFGIRIGIKWPNDLQVGGHKLAGMLSEARVDSDGMQELVFGLGLNINGLPGDLPEEVRGIATSLRHVTGRIEHLSMLAPEIARIILDGYQEYINGGAHRDLARRWPEFDVLYDQNLSFEENGQHATGIGKGIDSDGSLRVLLSDGRVKSLNAGEVTLQRR